MPLIQFLKTPLPKPGRSKQEIEARLRKHLIKQRASERCPPIAVDHEDENYYDPDIDRIALRELSWRDEHRISARAQALSNCATTKSPVNRLKIEDRQRIEALAGGVNVTAPPTEARADEIAAALHAEFPWMQTATETLWHRLRRAAAGGEAGLQIEPILLNGPPAVGKSAWARHLAGLIGTTSMVFEASHENASFGLVGSQRGWGNAAPGRLLNHIIDNSNASPVIIVDEAEKAGNVQSDKGQQFSLSAALLPLLEPLSARRWTCPFFELQFNMSYVVWILTSNDAGLLPEPLLSRCPRINVRRPSPLELQDFVRRQNLRFGLSEGSIDAICTVLQQQKPADLRVDLRLVLRMLRRAEALESRPINH